jgi:hypothetical protein
VRSQTTIFETESRACKVCILNMSSPNDKKFTRYRTNSQQSIRIRSLENDCSRLLAENLSLREQVLQLQNTLESQPLRPSFDSIDAVKTKLEAKMLELGGLVAELGQMKKADERPRSRSQLAATRRSPEERQWRSGLGLQEVENQMLPTITEDKFYPRHTMGYVDLIWSEGVQVYELAACFLD